MAFPTRYIRGKGHTMDYTIDIASKRELMAGAYEEASRLAARTVDGEGNALYDGILPTSGDMETLLLMLDDAVSILMARMIDVMESRQEVYAWMATDGTVYYTMEAQPSVGSTVYDLSGDVNPYAEITAGYNSGSITVHDIVMGQSYACTEDGKKDNLRLDLPDLDTQSMTRKIQVDAKRYLTFYMVAAWCKDRYNQVYEDYSARAKGSLDMLAADLYKRRMITRRFS